MELPREMEAGVDSESNDRSVFVYLIVASPICGSFSTRHGSDSPVRLGGASGLLAIFWNGHRLIFERRMRAA